MPYTGKEITKVGNESSKRASGSTPMWMKLITRGEKYRSATQINSRHAGAFTGWGNALAADKNYEGAIRQFSLAITANPHYARAYNDWGWMLQNQNDYDGAANNYDLATREDPSYALAYKNWGDTLGNQQRYK